MCSSTWKIVTRRTPLLASFPFSQALYLVWLCSMFISLLREPTSTNRLIFLKQIDPTKIDWCCRNRSLVPEYVVHKKIFMFGRTVDVITKKGTTLSIWTGKPTVQQDIFAHPVCTPLMRIMNTVTLSQMVGLVLQKSSEGQGINK